MVQCFLVESYSILLKNGPFFLFLSFVLSFCKSNDIHKKNLFIAINADASIMQKSIK